MHSAKRTTLGVTKLALPIVALSFLLFASIRTQLSPTRNDVHIDPSTVFLAEGSQDFSIAVLSDMHIRNNEGSYRQLEEVVEDILESKPDLLVILGDFTSEISREDLKEAHRKQVAERLKPSLYNRHSRPRVRIAPNTPSRRVLDHLDYGLSQRCCLPVSPRELFTH